MQQGIHQAGQTKIFRPFKPTPDNHALQLVQFQATTTAREIAAELKTRFSATRVVLFGSLARHEFHPWSDIDIAVWGIPENLYFRAVAFACGYSGTFKVELVDGADCTADLYRSIVEEGVEI